MKKRASRRLRSMVSPKNSKAKITGGSLKLTSRELKGPSGDHSKDDGSQMSSQRSRSGTQQTRKVSPRSGHSKHSGKSGYSMAAKGKRPVSPADSVFGNGSRLLATKRSQQKKSLKSLQSSDAPVERIFTQVPLMPRPDPSEAMPPEREAMIARYRKTILQKDLHK